MLQPLWIWAILGLVLLGTEMLTGTLYILWFGVAALLVAFLLWLFPALPVAGQLLLYTVFSLGSLAIWKRYYKTHAPDLKVGQSQGDEIGRVGVITEAVTPETNGRIQFAQGLMGSREWTAVADAPIPAGAHAMVVAVEGNSLRVKAQ